jgi:hypothetical protein
MDLPGWQALREELHPVGLEIVTVGLEMGGVDVLRPFIEDASPQHPSLIDETHRMDALFGVTNIPSWIWIDEDGIIVRPHESAVPPPVMRRDGNGDLQPWGMGGRYGFDADRSADMLRDWVRKGPDSEFALMPAEVVARSHPQSVEVSEAVAHFELAQHLWRQEGFSERTLAHFARAHTLQPDNITYKRQAYSQYRVAITERADDRTRFDQSPAEGEAWPFVSDFTTDSAAVRARRDAEAAGR